MKKFFFVLILLLLLCSSKCDTNNEQPSYLFQETYSQFQEDKIINDVDSLMVVYKIKNIPLKNWMTNRLIKENGYIEQKMVSIYNNSMTITFIYNKYGSTDSTYYQLKVRKIVNNK